MARQRFIWPSLWEDPAIGRLSSDHKLLFIGCFSNADDDGRLLGEAHYLKAVVFPYTKISIEKVAKLRDEIAAKIPSFRVYEIGGNKFITFLKWCEYQKPKYAKPSKIPPPPKRQPRKPAPVSQKSSGKSGGKSGEDPGKVGQVFPRSSGTGLGLGLGLGLGKAKPLNKGNRSAVRSDEPAIETLGLDKSDPVNRLLCVLRKPTARAEQKLRAFAGHVPEAAFDYARDELERVPTRNDVGLALKILERIRDKRGEGNGFVDLEPKETADDLPF